MTHPVLYEGGGNNLSEVDWDDPDIGEYIYLCPDKRRANFEYGSILIVHEAIRGPIEEAFSPQDRAPSKIKRDLEKMVERLDKLPPDTVMHPNVTERLTTPVEEIKQFMLRSINP